MFELSNKNYYSLGEIARNQINKKLYSSEFFKKGFLLTPEDILGTLNFLINSKNKCDFFFINY